MFLHEGLVDYRWYLELLNYLILIGFIVMLFFIIWKLKVIFIKSFSEFYDEYNFNSKELRGIVLFNSKHEILYKSYLAKKIIDKMPGIFEDSAQNTKHVKCDINNICYEISFKKFKFFTFKMTVAVIQNLNFKENYELIKTAVDKINDIIFITDDKGCIIYANNAFVEVTGYDYEEYYLKNPRIIKSGEMPPEYYKDVWEKLANDIPVSSVVTNRKKNGELFLYKQNISILKDSVSKKKYYISTGEDVTLAEKQKSQLLAERNNFRTLFNQSSNLLLKVSSEGDVLEISDSALNLVSKSRDYFLGKNLCVYFDELSLEYEQKDIMPKIDKMFLELSTKGDQTYRIKSSVLESKDILIELSDISEAVRAEFFLQSKNSILEFQIEKKNEEIVFEKNKLYAFLNGIGTPLIILGSNFKIEFMNDYSKEIFEIKEEDDIRNFENFIISYDLLLIKEKINADSANNLSFDAKYTMNNKEFYILWTLSNVVFDDEESSYILIGDDISNIKELISHQEELLATLKKKTKDIQCLYSISEVANSSMSLKELVDEISRIVNFVWAFNEEIRIEVFLFEKNSKIQEREQESLLYITPIIIDKKEEGKIVVYKDKNIKVQEEIYSFINSVGAILSNAVNKNIFETKLIENQEKLIELQKLGNLGTWEYMPERDILILSEVSKQILGAGELFSMNDFINNLVDGDKTQLISSIEEIKNSKEPNNEYKKELEIRYSRKNEGEVNLVIQIKSAFDYNKKIKMLGTIYEITDFIEIQEQLELAKIEAENSNRAKSAFLANMSHEIRTPLNAILGFSQMLLRRSSIIDEDKKQLQIINGSGEHLLSLINDILDISKVESGQVAVQAEKFNLFTVLEDIKNMFFHKADEKGIIFNINYNEDTPRYIISDPKKIRQVLVNLLGNSFKFTDEGAITLSLFTKLFDNNRCSIQFKVQDTGIGISEKEQARVFENFYQASNSRAGTGLGLSITQNLIELLGARISVSSKLYEGSTFEFTLEVEMDPKEGDNNFERTIGRNFYNPTDRVIKALIVDDVIENVALLSALLKNIKADVYTGLTAEEGLSVFDRIDFDIVFMDIRLPDLDGKEVIKKMRSYKDKKQPKIVGISASTFKEDIEDVIISGADDFVSKPINIEEVYLLLPKLLDLQLAVEGENSEEIKKPTLDFGKIIMDEKLKRDFYDAIDQGDFFSIGNLIDELDDSNSDIKDKLKEYLDNFEYEKIKKILDDVKTS